MRITNRLMTDNSIRTMSDSLDTLYSLQQKAAAGKKYLRPSDNPAVTADNLTLNSSLRSIETYTNSIQYTKQWMETTDFALQRFSESLAKAQQIVLKGLHDTFSPEERKVMGAEIDGLLNQMIDVANYSDQGRYVFSGFKTDTKPFELISRNDPASPVFTATALSTDGVTILTKDYHVDTVVYRGDSNTIKRSISDNETITVNVNGGMAFTDSTGGGNIFSPAVKDVFAVMIRIRDYLMGEDYLKKHVSSNNIQPVPPVIEEAVPGDTAGIDPATAVPPYTANDVLNLNLLSEAYTGLKNTSDKINSLMATNGARMKIVQTSLERAEKASLEIKSILSRNEDVNMAELISEINHQEFIYQTTIDVSGRIGSVMSLFDALR